jgi:hypothetical protein
MKAHIFRLGLTVATVVMLAVALGAGKKWA